MKEKEYKVKAGFFIYFILKRKRKLKIGKKLRVKVKNILYTGCKLGEGLLRFFRNLKQVGKKYNTIVVAIGKELPSLFEINGVREGTDQTLVFLTGKGYYLFRP